MTKGDETMYNLVQVRYRNNREGLVDDVTLNELIVSGKVKQFYRPSESRWVDVDHDSVRAQSNGYKGPDRRKANEGAKKEEPVGFISKILRRKAKEKPGQSIKSVQRKASMSFKYLVSVINKIFHA